MRTKTLASLLILCGSTAAIAQVSTEPQDTLTNNSVIVDNSVDPSGDLTTAPDADTSLDTGAPGNTVDDAPPEG